MFWCPVQRQIEFYSHLSIKCYKLQVVQKLDVHDKEANSENKNGRVWQINVLRHPCSLNF